MAAFGGTQEEARFAVADCQLAVARGDLQAAVEKLRLIPAASPHYLRARWAADNEWRARARRGASRASAHMPAAEVPGGGPLAG